MKKLRLLFERLTIVGIVLMMVAGFASCRDGMKDIYKGDEDDKEEEEKVPNDFDFSTWQEVSINLKYDVATGYRVPFALYTSNPLSIDAAKSYVLDTSILPFWEGYADEQGTVSIKTSLPAYAKDIYAYSTGLSVPRLLHASINNGNVGSFEEMDASVAKGINSRTVGLPINDTKGATTVANVYKNWFPYLMNCITEGTAKNVEKRTLLSKDLNTIENTMPKVGEADKVGVYYVSSIKLKEAARVRIYLVGHSGQRTNALTYFAYNEDNVPFGSYSAEDVAIKLNRQLRMAMPALTSSVQQGTGVMLLNAQGEEKFEAGTILSFGLLVDAYNDGALKSKANIAFSNYGENEIQGRDSFNDYVIVNRDNGSLSVNQDITITKNAAHMLAFRLEDNKICIAFEDQPWSAGRRTSYWGDFRDDVFIMEVDPETAIPDEIQPGDKGDNSYTATSTACGILSFEDNWPQAGDYDMNDAVISYIRKYRLDASLSVTSLDDEFIFSHNGASFQNAFGYELGGIKDKSNIKGEVTVSSAYTCSGQGLDEGLDIPTVMLFDRAVSVGTSFKVHVDFKSSVEYANFTMFNKWNPFIVANGFTEENRTEVHLPLYPPTKKANMDLFNTEDDVSDVAKGRYYVRSKDNMYPFALELSGAMGYAGQEYELPLFVIPQEKVPIEESYPYFVKWYESNGKKYKNWYTENPTE